MFFLRFGKCNQGEECPYIHDKEKVSICRKFLKGKCTDQDCLLSHKLDKEKMPVCNFFLNGNCNNDDCIYSHVYVNPDAKICSDFFRGYCPRGLQCKKKHTFICQEFLQNNSCSKGENCKFLHRDPSDKKRKLVSEEENLQQKKLKLDMPKFNPQDFEKYQNDTDNDEDESDSLSSSYDSSDCKEDRSSNEEDDDDSSSQLIIIE